ncbi:MAG: twin-arginine translocase TatA/TatE family subunit [Chloroflexota bacterium]
MDFMGIGFGELIVIMAIALLILGPQRLARTARSAGKMVREVKEMGGEFTRSLLDETKDESGTGKPKG